MNTLILHISEPEHWNPQAWLLAQGGVSNKLGEIRIQKNQGWLSFYHAPDILDDYHHEERATLFSLIKPQKSYVLIWRHDEQLAWFINATPQHTDAVVDNDYGIICRLADVQHLALDEWIRRPELLRASDSSL